MTIEQPGLRERKKQRTRQLIAETAARLFAERGFEGVTVADIARAADVSDKTVFNYFPTKEDLFYSRLESFEDDLLESIRSRPAGEPVLTAFERFMLNRQGLLAAQTPEEQATALERTRTMTRVVTASPSLLAREQRAFATYTASLARLLAEETGVGEDDPRPWVVANTLIGVHRSLLDYVRRRTLDGASFEELISGYDAAARRAFELVANGLGDYAIKS